MGLVHATDALGSGFDTVRLESAGYVSRIEVTVDYVKVGDRVMILGTSSTGLATQVQRPGPFTLAIPDHLSVEDVAIMPSVYATVLIGLVDKAQLRQEGTVASYSCSCRLNRYRCYPHSALDRC